MSEEEDNRFLLCAKEHKESLRTSMDARNRFQDTAVSFKREKRTGGADFAPHVREAMKSDRSDDRRRRRVEAMEREMASYRKAEEARLRRIQLVEREMEMQRKREEAKRAKATNNRSDQDVRQHMDIENSLLQQSVPRKSTASTYEESFPSLPSTPNPPKTPKTPFQLEGSMEKVIVKELPLPAPVGVAFRPDGSSRAIYSFENPDYVPVSQTVTIVEKAKSACWSQRLKDSLQSAAEPPRETVGQGANRIALWDTNIDASDGEAYPCLQSVLRSVDPDLDPDSE